MLSLGQFPEDPDNEYIPALPFRALSSSTRNAPRGPDAGALWPETLFLWDTGRQGLRGAAGQRPSIRFWMGRREAARRLGE